MGLARSAAATQATTDGVEHGVTSDGARVPPPSTGRDRGDLPQRVVSAKVSLWHRIGEIWSSRELLVFLVRKELKIRYKSSVLGFLWSFLNPALILIIYYVVFKYFLHNPTPDFALFLFAGLLAWNVFNNSLLSSSGVLVAHAGLVKKVAFPRQMLALAQVGTAICYFFFQTCILVIFLVGFRVAPAFDYIPILLFALLCDILLAAGLAVFLSAVNVYLRDVQHFVEVLLVALFFSPPIVYSYATVAKDFHHTWFSVLYHANPLMWIVVSFQRCIYGGVIPPGGKVVPGVQPVPFEVLPTWGASTYLIGLSCVFVASIILFIVAMVIFGRVEGNFAEEL